MSTIKKVKYQTSTLLVCLGLLAFVTPVSATNTDGDYSFAESFKNRFVPPKANKPITDADQAKVPLPIKAARKDFKDGFSPAVYGIWQEVTLDPATGASCGDGSPYKFWVNRKPSTSNILTVLEGGGACWDYKGCSSNIIKGVFKNFFKPQDKKDSLAFFSASTLQQNSALARMLLGIGTTFTKDFSPHYKNKTQKWTKVYLPYCTGDVHMGFGTQIYTDPKGKGKPVVVHHKGAINMLQVSAWLRNNLQAPKQFMLTGYSAGGVGANSLYFAARKLFDVKHGYMLNDGGPIWFADKNGSLEQNPTKALYSTALKPWGMSRKLIDNNGTRISALDWYQTQMPGFDKNNMGSLNNAMANAFPQDRFALMTFQEDYIFSSFIYRRFLPDTNVSDAKQRKANTFKYWQHDIKTFTQSLTANNYGYYFPATRSFLYAHTLSGKPDKTADIQEQGLSFNSFMKNVTEEQNTDVLRAKEQDFEADRKQTDVLGKITEWFLNKSGI